MSLLTFGNPVFAVFAICAALGVLKVMGQGWWTVRQMFAVNGGYATPEDAGAGLINPDPRPGQLDPHEPVERSRRMHRNDLENIPAFWVAGLLFTMTDPVSWVAYILMGGFVVARAGHAYAYWAAKGHDLRATFYTLGSLSVMAMGGWVAVVGAMSL